MIIAEAKETEAYLRPLYMQEISRRGNWQDVWKKRLFGSGVSYVAYISGLALFSYTYASGT